MKQTKKDIYKSYGIDYKDGKIYSEFFKAYIPLLLINGNDKIGKGVYHFSTLPTNKTFNVTLFGVDYAIKGTCPLTCPNCYATKGKFNCETAINSNAVKTLLIRNDIDFVKSAINAQIKADDIKFIRVHASGDFDSLKYIMMWISIAVNNPHVRMWTYTKNSMAENAFNSVDNFNVVKSVIKGFGFNFGHIDYILKVFDALKKQGKKVYICRCGIDKSQHCTNCKACSENEYVLFIEHATAYKAIKDKLYSLIVKVIENQPNAYTIQG